MINDAWKFPYWIERNYRVRSKSEDGVNNQFKGHRSIRLAQALEIPTVIVY